MIEACGGGGGGGGAAAAAAVVGHLIGHVLWLHKTICSSGIVGSRWVSVQHLSGSLLSAEAVAQTSRSAYASQGCILLSTTCDYPLV